MSSLLTENLFMIFVRCWNLIDEKIIKVAETVFSKNTRTDIFPNFEKRAIIALKELI